MCLYAYLGLSSSSSSLLTASFAATLLCSCCRNASIWSSMVVSMDAWGAWVGRDCVFEDHFCQKNASFKSQGSRPGLISVERRREEGGAEETDPHHHSEEIFTCKCS